MGALAGKRIVVTRATAQAGPLIDALRGVGADPVSFPTIEITRPVGSDELRQATRLLASNAYNWLILTSQNSVQSIEQSVHLPASLKVGAVGLETAAAFDNRFGREPEFVSHGGTSTDLALNVPIAAGDSILIPLSAVAKPELGEIMRNRGATVTEVVAYETQTPIASSESHRELLGMDAITFASGSAVRGFLELTAGSPARSPDVPVVCIGHSTADVARSAGFQHIRVADQHSVAGLIEVLESIFINYHVLRETT